MQCSDRGFTEYHVEIINHIDSFTVQRKQLSTLKTPLADTQSRLDLLLFRFSILIKLVNPCSRTNFIQTHSIPLHYLTSFSSSETTNTYTTQQIFTTRTLAEQKIIQSESKINDLIFTNTLIPIPTITQWRTTENLNMILISPAEEPLVPVANKQEVTRGRRHYKLLSTILLVLAVSAQGFRRGANRVRKQMWWKDMKMRMCLILGIIILLVIIISLLPSIKKVQTKNGKRNVNDGILGYRDYEKRDMNTCTEFHGTKRLTPNPLGLLHGETLHSWEGNERGFSDSGVDIFEIFYMMVLPFFFPYEGVTLISDLQIDDTKRNKWLFRLNGDLYL
ncbi:hypothetical protein EYC80_006979 [Monilinia laxa]|uniref:V-SNARE coiled-coil homology domain-containing protein n=1 Tax=Monilinia laxa TaxID=61186 RepID=A0A5N6JZR5_MONLA|nr:hypothetical protein EYC80_006979 [Monilinia laxa]